MDDVIITARHPSKYMHDIGMHFKAKYINDYTNYFLGKLVQFGNHIIVLYAQVSEDTCKTDELDTPYEGQVVP